MQREIEALLVAYLEERQKEARIVQELLTALSVGAAGRQKMFDAIMTIGQLQAAPVADKPVVAEPGASSVHIGSSNRESLSIVDDLTVGIGNLRKARDAALMH
jgi:hypothetical protein